MKKFSVYTWALVCILVAFFCAQIFGLASFKTTGDSLEYLKDKTVVYNVEFDCSGEKLDAVYLNIGSIYTEYGKDAEVTVKYSTSASSTSFSTFGHTVTVGNVYSATGVNGANFNWLSYADGQAAVHKQNIKRISFTATAGLQLREIVAFSDKGKQAKITVATSDESGYDHSELAKACDAQKNFTKSTAARSNFTQDEAYALTAIRTVFGGKKALGENVYNLNGEYNYLATLFALPSVAIFGESTFALRLPSVLATASAVVALYLLVSAILKKEKYGFIAGISVAFGGLATSVGALGTPLAFVFSALLFGVYFMHRFYAKGISSAAPLKGGLNVLFSAAFVAVAVCMDMSAAIPALGVAALFLFGLRRQKRAYAVQLEKIAPQVSENGAKNAETEVGEQTKTAMAKLQSGFEYKQRISIGFALLGSFVFGFLLLLIGGVLCYSAAVKAYDTPGNQTLSFIELVWKAWIGTARGGNVTEFTSANVGSVFAWLLPLRGATLYDGVFSSGEGVYLRLNAIANPVVNLVSFLSLALVTVKVSADIVAKKSDKETLRVRRAYFILLGGLALTMLAAAVKGTESTAYSLLFSAFYEAFIPLSYYLGYSVDKPARIGKKQTTVMNIAAAILLIGIGVAFILSIASTYGFAVPTGVSKIFSWMSILSNGYIR